ncbi:MAG: site-specific integrase [Ktedonobacteraceae bacterium]|nr:site-specific integrase [Ktedonobacteraceae bacterium]
MTLGKAFEHFLDSASFARRTRESYTDDLAPLLTQYGQAPVAVLTTEIIQAYLACQETLAPTTYNRRLAALRSFLNFLQAQGYRTEELLAGIERKPERTRETRALDAQRVESVLRQITDPHDRALFWLIYDGGLRCQEALAIDIEDISWPDRSIAIHGKGGRPCETFFCRAVGTLLDKYLLTRSSPRFGPLFVTHRKARLPRRADLMAMLASPTVRRIRSGRNTRLAGISTNSAIPPSASEPPMITPRSVSNALAAILPYAAWNATLPTTAKRPNAKLATGNAANARKIISNASNR